MFVGYFNLFFKYTNDVIKLVVPATDKSFIVSFTPVSILCMFVLNIWSILNSTNSHIVPRDNVNVIPNIMVNNVLDYDLELLKVPGAFFFFF